MRIIAYLLWEEMQDRWQSSNIFEVLKEKSPANLVLYPVKIFF